MGIIKKCVISITAVIIALAVALSFGGNKNDVTISIEQGESLSQIADTLKENDIILSKYLFMIKTKLSGNAANLKYGEFVLSSDMSYDEIITKLTKEGAKKETITLTVPEGYSVEMIGAKCEELGICTKDEFLTALGDNYDYEFLKEIPDGDVKYSLQGFLFPSTYEIFADATAHDVIDTMLKEFKNQYPGSYEGIFKVLTKAALVEREAKLSSERKTISGVIQNRIDKNMLLEIDASVVYAITDGMYDVDVVYYRDLEVDSKYNTYKYPGLPAGPICNPGLESIVAAMKPEKHEYLYYHTDEVKKDGSHIFTKTFEEHTSTMN